MGLSLLLSQKSGRKIFKVYSSSVQSIFSFSTFPLTWTWPSPLKWLRNLCQLKSLISLCLSFKGSLFCAHGTTGTIQVACVQDFGGSKSIVGFPLRSHSCSSFEQPPDHTRRLTQNSRGAEERRRSLPVIKYWLFVQSLLCLRVGRLWRSETSGSRLMEAWQYFGSRKPRNWSFNLQLLISDIKNSQILFRGLKTKPTTQTNQWVLSQDKS